VELVFGINYFLFVGYSEYCAFAIYQGGISCTIHFPNVPAYLDLFAGFQHRCYWILSGMLLCRLQRVLLLMLVLIGGHLFSR
jgi:hypothetical protein